VTIRNIAETATRITVCENSGIEGEGVVFEVGLGEGVVEGFGVRLLLGFGEDVIERLGDGVGCCVDEAVGVEVDAGVEV
jgi:hypothetical protein